MGSCSPSLWHRFQRCTLSRGKVDFGRWLTPGFPPGFTQRVHLMGSRVIVYCTTCLIFYDPTRIQNDAPNSYGWLHFYFGHLALQKVHFARCGRTSHGGPSPRSRALIHISPSSGCTQWVAPRAQIAQPRPGRAIRVVKRGRQLALSTWRRHRMLSEW